MCAFNITEVIIFVDCIIDISKFKNLFKLSMMED